MGLFMPDRPFQILVAMRSEATGEIYWVAGKVSDEFGKIVIGFHRDVPPLRDQPPGPWHATVDAVIETPMRGWQRGTPEWPAKGLTKGLAKEPNPLPEGAKEP